MPGENELKPLEIGAMKAATSRIDLSKATIPASPSLGGIRIGANPKKATSKIDLSVIPGASKAQTSSMSIGSMPAVDDDIYKRRTTLLDTSNIPLATSPAAQPRTVRIGNRPTVRVGAAAAPVTFTPGRAEEEAAAAPAEAPTGRPTIKLKRPGGGISITTTSGDSSSSTSLEPTFTIQSEEDDSPGAVWAVLSIFSTLVIIGLIVVQIMTMNEAVY